MKTTQEFTASVHFNLPDGCHVWLPQIVFHDEDTKYRLQAKSSVSLEDAKEKLREAAQEILRAV